MCVIMSKPIKLFDPKIDNSEKRIIVKHKNKPA